jgi:hypothetical protein
MDIDLYKTRDLGDSVPVFTTVRTKGKSSDVKIEQEIGYLFEFEDGLVRRASSFLRPEEAVKAAGLSE